MILEGPGHNDFANIRALNSEFVRIICARPALSGLDDAHQRQLHSLRHRQRDWLAGAPFLLFSLYEREATRWQQLLADQPSGNLFDVAEEPGGLHELAAAAAGFLWQLSRQNPHAARMISGASPTWCDQVATATYFDLLYRVRRQRVPITARQAGGVDLWARLLGPGVSPESDVRSAAHIAALQSVLTTGSESEKSDWRLAASASRAPNLRVAEKD